MECIWVESVKSIERERESMGRLRVQALVRQRIFLFTAFGSSILPSNILSFQRDRGSEMFLRYLFGWNAPVTQIFGEQFAEKFRDFRFVSLECLGYFG